MTGVQTCALPIYKQVIMILRGEETVVPNGDTVIMENDLLVIYSVPEYRKNLPVKELPAG